MHGRIIRFRIAVSLIAPLAVLSAGMTASAQASSSLLSGYGGPGSGSQVILGSTLLNGSRGGGGSGGPAIATSSTKSQASAVGETAMSTGSTLHGPVTGAGGQGNTADRTVKTAPGRALTGLAGPGNPRAARDSQTLGLTSADLLYILLVCGALAGVGLLTRRLARISPREAGT
jgi:hypothetical protein